jgi:hypothetical protein
MMNILVCYEKPDYPSSPSFHESGYFFSLQGVSKNKKKEFGQFFHVFSTRNFFQNDPIRANFMRGIDCAFPKLENASLIQGN